MLVFHRRIDGQLNIFQYMPKIPRDPNDPAIQYVELSGSKTKLIDYRRLELLQRFYLNGRLDYAYEDAKELLYAK